MARWLFNIASAVSFVSFLAVASLEVASQFQMDAWWSESHDSATGRLIRTGLVSGNGRILAIFDWQHQMSTAHQPWDRGIKLQNWSTSRG